MVKMSLSFPLRSRTALTIIMVASARRKFGNRVAAR